jgi:cytochrome c553
MKTISRLLFCGLTGISLLAVSRGISIAQETPPPWAYPVSAADFKPVADDGSIRRVPDSSGGITLTQARDRFVAQDWHPEDHPPMPEIVAKGRKPLVYACGFCHRADGPGGPENANLTGLSADYIIRQMKEFRSGARQSSVTNRPPIQVKAFLLKSVTDEEIASAAAYFSTLPARSIVKVVETEMVPKTMVAGSYFAPAAGGEREPIGMRIVEFPDDVEQFESRDARALTTAYVPVGSIGKGRALATTGEGGKTLVCEVCHGVGLKGSDIAPLLAGRSPTYIVRQLYDFKYGKRAGAMSGPMEPTVKNLSVDDMLALAAYAASLKP